MIKTFSKLTTLIFLIFFEKIVITYSCRSRRVSWDRVFDCAQIRRYREVMAKTNSEIAFFDPKIFAKILQIFKFCRYC